MVTASTARLPASATQITINGLGFDATAANNTVTFNDGAVGTDMTASPTALTVTFTTKPTTAGSLTAVVTTDKQTSGAAVQVATVTPVVTANTANLAASASQITIKGLGFDPTSANNTVTFNDGAVGTVMTASPTALTVTFSTRPTTAGSLTAVVTTDKHSSGAAVQVATVTPVVTASTAQLPATATQITINGLGFDPTAANNTVTFNDGAAGTVTKASPTSFTVTLTTKPTTSGSLSVVVATDKISSGTAVQVATVTPVVTASMGHLAANAPQITINGFGFDPTAANNTVAFNDGAVGTVTTATPTSLTVNFSTKPTTAGSLTAVVTTDNQSSGAAVQVAAVTSAVTVVVSSSTANLAAGAGLITIQGSGFDPTAAYDTVTFNDGAVGSVTAATSTALTVTISTRPTTAGSLTAIVHSDGVSSGSAVQVATVAPVVTSSTAAISANPSQITIHGFGFDSTVANNTVTFNLNAHGTVNAATPTSLTVTFTGRPTTVGSLTAVVTTDKISSATAVQVATVTPMVTASTAPLAASATQITIHGLDFDATAADDTVAFNDGAAGTVITATATALTVNLSSRPATAGSLTAVVATDKISSGTAVQVATVTPVVTASTANLAANAPQITINGFGFDPTVANNTVAFNDGAVGTVATASPTALTVTFSTKPTATGSLTAVVTTDKQSSGAAVQVATVIPPVTVVVTSSTASLPDNAAQITIHGSGFDPTAAYDAVTFNEGAVGSVTAATSTALTVTFSTTPTTAGSLTAIVHSDGVSSGSAVQVATVTPVVTASNYGVAASATTFTFKGFGFDPTAAHDTVVFNDGAVGKVATANSTAMTVKFTTEVHHGAGSLTAVVAIDDESSGAPVQVGTVTPVVTAITANLPANASQITINGFGFNPTAADNTVAFNDGAVGTVTTASPTSLTVTFSTKPKTAGNLTAVVTTDNAGVAENSSNPLQVATVT